MLIYLETNMTNHGIISLSGFAFQIRVFIYYLSEISDGESLGYEVLDDIVLKNDNLDEIDTNIFVKGIPTFKAIQVKKSDLKQADMKKILKNWLILELGDKNIDEYHLVLEGSMDGELFDNKLVDALYHDIETSSSKRKDSLDQRLRAKKLTKDELETTIGIIKEKFQLQLNNIDKLIDAKFTDIFHKVYSQVVYNQRVEEMCSHITCQIIKNARRRLTYSLDYKSFIDMVEDIARRFTKERSEPSYVDFKQTNKIDLEDLKIVTSREFIQLQYCDLTEGELKKHLIHKLYFENALRNSLETGLYRDYENLLETTYENYQETITELNRKKNDFPIERLIEINKKSNSYATNEQIKFGSSIYLTRDAEVDRLISWKDEA